MYNELLDEFNSLFKPITTNIINSFLNDLITESKNKIKDEIDLKGKINKYFPMKTDDDNGSSIEISDQTEFDSKVRSTGFSRSSNKNCEIKEEINKNDDKYRGFVDRLFDFLVNENDENIENFFKDLHERVKNDLTEVSEV